MVDDTLTIMCGGAEADVERARPLFEVAPANEDAVRRICEEDPEMAAALIRLICMNTTNASPFV